MACKKALSGAKSDASGRAAADTGDEGEEMSAKAWMSVRQQAVAIYFYDKLAIRGGGDKDTAKEADTVGCCNLRVEHIRFWPPGADAPTEREWSEDNIRSFTADESRERWDKREEVRKATYLAAKKLDSSVEEDEFADPNDVLDGHRVTLDFLGKDSIRYYNTFVVEACVYKALQIFVKKKKKGEKIFDAISLSKLNEFLQKSYMEGLSAKVFRTYNASIMIQEELRKLDHTKKLNAEEWALRFKPGQQESGCDV